MEGGARGQASFVSDCINFRFRFKTDKLHLVAEASSDLFLNRDKTLSSPSRSSHHDHAL